MAAVLFDHGEVKSGIPAALDAAGLDVSAVRLPAGDYLVSDRLVVERKTGADLAASIKDRRLFEQLDRLREAYTSVVLLVEGQPVHIAEPSWKGALARVLTTGVSALQTSSRQDSAAWLVRLHRLEGKGPSDPRGRPRRPTDDLRQTAEDVLGCLPGISTVTARRLLTHFGSLASVFAADETQLRAVAGIGPIRAARLAQLFHDEG